MKTKTWIVIFSAAMAVILVIASIIVVVAVRMKKPRRYDPDSDAVVSAQSDYTEEYDSTTSIPDEWTFPSDPGETTTFTFEPETAEATRNTTSTTTRIVETDQWTTKRQRIVSIDIKSLPNKTTYYFGDSVSSSGLVVEAIYANGERKSISNDALRFSVPNMSSPGSKSVIVRFTDPSTNETLSTSFSVQIKEPQITISKNDLRVLVGESYSLSATTVPYGCAVQWESASGKIARVGTDGTVTGVGSGNTTITACFTYNGIKYYSEACFVAVSLRESEISIEDAEWYDGYFDRDEGVFYLRVSGTVFSNYKLDTVEIGWYGPQYINGAYSSDFRLYFDYDRDEINGYSFDLDQDLLDFESIPGETYLLYIYAEDVHGGTDVCTCEITAE